MASIFTKIINREIPASLVYEDERVIAIHDIAPKAKTHILIIPKKEIPTMDDITWEDTELIGHLFQVAKKIAVEKWLTWAYKLQCNVWLQGWQEVFHIHIHLTSDL